MDTSPDGRALGRAGVSLSLISVVALAALSLAGPSVARVELGGPGPSRSFGIPVQGLWAILILFCALLVGAAGVVCAWTALRRGWTPNPRRLITAGIGSAALLAIAPPMGSTDIAIYAAYGRMLRLGLDPYTHTVLDLIARGDPIGRAYPGVWTDVGSVYGPVAMLWNGAGALFGGESARWIVWWFQLTAALFFVAIALLLDRRAAELGTVARARVALLWTLNPLVLFELVSGAHVDVLAVLLGIGALLSLRRSPVLSGVLVALAVAVKVTFGLYALAIAWALRRDWRPFLRWLIAAVITATVVVAPVMPSALGPLREGSRRTTGTSIWHPVVVFVHHLAGIPVANDTVAVGSLLLLVLVMWRVTPALSSWSQDRSALAIRLGAAFGLSWLLTSTYALPWYVGLALAPLVLLPATWLDLVLLCWLTATVLAGMAGATQQTGAIELLVTTLRSTVPYIGWLLVLVVLVAGPRLRLPRPAESPAP